MTRIGVLKRRRMEMFLDDLYHSRANVFDRVYRENPQEPKIIRRAKALSAFLREKKILFDEDDLLAGYQQFYDYSEPPDQPTICSPPMDRGGNGPVVSELETQFRKGLLKCSLQEDPAVLKELEKAFRIGVFGSALGGHVIPDFKGLLHNGFGAIRKEAERKLAEGAEIDRDFLCAVIVVCDGVEAYFRRYAQRAKQLAQSTWDSSRRRELERISESCEWVALNPPRSFFEALQLLWLAHECLTAEQVCGALSLGRLDQYLFPYYLSDLQEGRITREEALELLEVLWIKFNGLWFGFQNVTLGGQNGDGGDATNELSYICLEATEQLHLPQPGLSVRIHQKTPDEFLQRVCEVLRGGGGLPAIFNDDVIMRAKKRAGIAAEDVWNYAIVGCVEPNVPGKEWSHTEALRINWAKVLELVLNNGVCTTTGERMNVPTRELSRFDSFEELYSCYKQALEQFTDFAAVCLNIIDTHFCSCSPYPYLSALMSECIRNGKDVTAGGTIYNLTSMNGCGMANTVDSLAAMKKLVYEDKAISLEELRYALRWNFSGKESLRQKLINWAAKYGNDNDYVDMLMRDLSDFFCGCVMRHWNPRGGGFQVGLYTVGWHETLGKMTGALPDGRMASTSLSNGLSPCQGRDTTGPTAVLKSIAKLDHSSLANGMVLDLKFHPTALSGAEGLEKFASLVKTYFALGGMEIQVNVVDRKTLEEAQEFPEDHGDLVVRVSGFSAYFTRLSRELQNEIIARSEHM